MTALDLQWKTTVTLASTATRRPTWTARPARRTITIALSVTPKALDSPADRTATNPVSGKRACTPAPRRVPSPFPVWRTSAATPGPAFRPMGVAPSPACSRWSGCRTSTSLLTSPQGLWCPDLAGSGATPLHSWVTVTTLPCTRAPWLTRHWAASAAPGLGSRLQQPPYRETSTSTRTASHAHCRHTSTTLYTASASCRSGTRTAKIALVWRTTQQTGQKV